MALIRRDIPLPATWPPPRTRRDVDDALDLVRRRDPVGDRVHGALALLFAGTLPLSTALSSIAFALLVGYAVIRLFNTWRAYTTLTRVPVLWVLLAWTLFTVASVAWSHDRGQGWDEVRAARMILVPFALWPVIRLAPALVVAALVGVFAQNLVQAAQAARLFGLEPEAEGRLDGILHAIHTGAWCAAAMTWHVSAALHGRGWTRWASLLAMVVAGAGLLMTGSRGPWLGAAVSVPLAVLVIGVRRPAARRAAIALGAAAVLATIAAAPIAQRVVVPRAERALQEVRAAREDGVYWTSVGLRVGLWQWAASMWMDAPIAGHGAGGFQGGLDALPEYRTVVESLRDRPSRLDWVICSHAHSLYLQTLATTGVIGAALLLATLVLVAWRCWRNPPDHVYADGMLFALVGWMIGAQFDCYTLNGHLFGLFALIVALTLSPRPVAAGLGDR